MTAFVVGAIDQKARNAHLAHFTKRDFLRTVHHFDSFWPQSSSRSRRTAGLSGFFDFSQVFDGPLRYGASNRFETMPSSPSRQACSKTAGPSWSICSL